MNHITDDMTAIKNFKKNITRDTEQIIFERQENNKLYGTMTWINQLYANIISGNIDGILSMLQTDNVNIKGVMASDALQDEKNQLLILLSNMLFKLEDDRYIEPNTLHAIIDSTSVLLEKQNSAENVRSAAIAGILVMSDEVQKIKRSDYHPLVRRTENYVFSHLHEKITVAEIAASLSTDPGYLTMVFHRHTGKTIKQYILDEKIDRAKNLLLNSEYEIKEIASYLGFADSSHFGREFKKRLDISPMEYRKRLAYK